MILRRTAAEVSKAAKTRYGHENYNQIQVPGDNVSSVVNQD
jgi:hypothetical protein